jgi:hypothetical protein
MRIPVIVFVTTALPLIACTGSRATTSATAAPAAARVTGTYIASLALTGRSTYTGTIELAPTARDSVRGTMVLTSPVRVDAPVAGVVRGDSLHLAGTYSAANGCTGTISLSFSLAAMPHTGPSKLVDRCVGPIDATFTARR